MSIDYLVSQTLWDGTGAARHRAAWFGAVYHRHKLLLSYV